MRHKRQTESRRIDSAGVASCFPGQGWRLYWLSCGCPLTDRRRGGHTIRGHRRWRYSRTRRDRDRFDRTGGSGCTAAWGSANDGSGGSRPPARGTTSGYRNEGSENQARTNLSCDHRSLLPTPNATAGTIGRRRAIIRFFTLTELRALHRSPEHASAKNQPARKRRRSRKHSSDLPPPRGRRRWATTFFNGRAMHPRNQPNLHAGTGRSARWGWVLPCAWDSQTASNRRSASDDRFVWNWMGVWVVRPPLAFSGTAPV
jgi:hypothetical protein